MHRATNEILRGKEIWCADHLLFKCQLFDGARHETKTNKIKNIRRRRDIRFISCDELTVVAFSFLSINAVRFPGPLEGRRKGTWTARVRVLPLLSRAIFYFLARHQKLRHSDLLSLFFLSNLPRWASSRSARKPGIELFLIFVATASDWRRSHICYQNEWVSKWWLRENTELHPILTRCHLSFISEHLRKQKFTPEIIGCSVH